MKINLLLFSSARSLTQMLVLTISASEFQQYCILAIGITLAFIILYFLIKKQYDKKKTQKRFSELQKVINAERQRISAEIHDDLGSALSALRIYAELASNRNPQTTELSQLSNMINEISKRINEIVWSTNSDSDHINHLIFYLEEEISKLFANSPIKFRSSLPVTIPNIVLSSISRKNIYLLIKEMAHNALKHSKAEETKLTITFNGRIMQIIFRDNGIGIDQAENAKQGMGTMNILKRAEVLGANIQLDVSNGTSYTIDIPLDPNSELFSDLNINESNYLQRLSEKRVTILSKSQQFY